MIYRLGASISIIIKSTKNDPPFDPFALYRPYVKSLQKTQTSPKNERFEAFKNFKVGANGFKVGLETVKLSPKVMKTIGATISIEKIEKKK